MIFSLEISHRKCNYLSLCANATYSVHVTHLYLIALIIQGASKITLKP
jgi:hypothetical protein